MKITDPFRTLAGATLVGARLATIAGIAVGALLLAACDGTIHITDPDFDNSISFVTASVPSGSTVDVGTRVAVTVRYRARQRSDIEARLLTNTSELAASPLVRVSSGRDEATLVVTASRAGDVEFIEVTLGDPSLDRIFDSQQVRWRIRVR
jgi:hypothetical protein